MKNTIVTVAALLVANVGLAKADVSKGVQKAFRGEIVITASPLPPSGETDKETIAAFKKARAKSLKHTTSSEGVPEWTFYFTAFMKKAPKVKNLSVDFYTADKERLYVANKRLMGVSPDLILSGSFTMSEDDNLNKGRKYLVKLTGQIRGREVVYATSKIKLE